MHTTTPSSYLSGQTAAITGGAGDLCSCMAEALCGLGVNTVILDVQGDRADSVAKGLRHKGGNALGIEADVTSRARLDSACEEIRAEFQGLHILINGAGGNRPGATTSDERSFFDLPAEALRQVFDLNCIGAMLASQAFGKLILDTVKKDESMTGNIINISSMNALRPLTRIPAYSAAKAAVSNFTQWLAVHLAQNYTPRIRVNAIAPGFFLTSQNRFLLLDEKSGDLTPRGRTILDHSPSGVLGRARDLVSTLLWLLDPDSHFINGAVVPVDGGFNAFAGV